MTDRERQKRFQAERRRQLARLPAIQRNTAAEIDRLLKAALAQIQARLGALPSEFESWHLPQLQGAINQALAETGRRGAATLGTRAGEAWQAGIDLVDGPLEAGFGPGFRVSTIAPHIDTRQLSAMRAFMTDRMRDITLGAANRINAELGLVAIGAKTQGQATTEITKLIAEGGRGRAITIVRTELGRAYSVATQARQAQAADRLPGLKKQWRRSGKIHSRPAHDVADGQIRNIDEPFLVGGIEIMFPRDPAAPASETINCGCASLPWMESWDMTQPGRKPFTDEELTRNPGKRDLEAALG